MFTIKICGVRSAEDLAAVGRSQADAVGLNFYRRSKRYVDPQVAAEWAATGDSRIARVALFVNASVEDVERVLELVSVDYLQLHGDEPPELLADLPPVPVIKAIRLERPEVGAVVRYVQRCSAAGTSLAGVLIDAYSAQEFGGTGLRAPWEVVPQLRAHLGPLPLILAGGLTPENVGEAIRDARPDAVDAASGVEVAAGRKDPQRVLEFARAARTALDRPT